MGNKYLRSTVLAVVIAGVVGVLAGSATAGPPHGPPGPPGPSSAINADFESYVNFTGNPALCSTPGAILVEGRGTATGPFGKFGSAIGTAAECSAGVFDAISNPAPHLGNCTPPFPGVPYFDVHGQGVYVTNDGSALYLTYHELSENPFAFFPPNGPGLPFFLHDCGIYTVDGADSTGIFHGATGHGSISATVPVRTDFSAHVLAAYTPDPDGALTLVGGAPKPPGPGDTHCTGTITGPVTGSVVVDQGATCVLDYATVNGDVHAQKGSTLVMQYSIASGNLDCNGCASVTVNPATVLGDLHANHSGGTTIVSSIVGGNLDVHNGTGASTILLNYAIGRDLMFHNNDGFSMVAGNTAGHTIDCHNNNAAPVLSFTVPFPPTFGVPSPTFTGNDAPNLKGQCSLFGLGPQPPPGG
jgi:hypothetical protein